MAASFMKARLVARHGKMTNCFSSDDATCPNGSHKYAYDGANRLTPINTTAAVYSYFGPQRIKKVLGSTTTRYIYLGSKPIAKYVGTTNPTLSTEYVYAGSQLLVDCRKHHHISPS